MVELSVQQNNDETVTYTVTGSDPAALNQIYHLRVGGQWGQDTSWTLSTTRTGDGTVTTTTGSGCFWFYLVSGSFSSTPVYEVVGDGKRSIWEQILEAVQARVRLLDLEHIPAGNVVTTGIVDETLIKDMKGGDRIIIAPASADVLTTTGPLQSDDVDRPTIIAHINAANRKQSKQERDRWFRIRDRIRRAFVNQPLVIPDGIVWRCTQRPVDPIIRSWWEDNAMVSPHLLVFTSREPRGMG